MKISELRQKNKSELNKILQELRDKLNRFRFEIAAKKVKNVREIRQIRRSIARILTVLNPKYQAPNSKQIPITEIQNSKQ